MMLDRVRKAIRSPGEVIPYVLGTSFSRPTLMRSLRYSPTWRQEDDYITFELGGFAGGTNSRPEYAARCYYEISQLVAILEKYDVSASNSVEIGCGYGRLTPWISEFSADHIGIDPNTAAIDLASRLYPNIRWEAKRLQDLSSRSNRFELVVSWTVLQHIPPSEIDYAGEILQEISTSGGYLMLCEKIKGQAGSHTWPRSVGEYEEILREFELISTEERQLEPSYPEQEGKVMMFKYN